MEALTRCNSACFAWNPRQMESESPTNASSPAPPKIVRQLTACDALAAASPSGRSSPLSLAALGAALAPGFARAPSSAYSIYTAPTPLVRGSSPGASGRGLHVTAFKPVPPGVLQLPMMQSPSLIAPLQKSRAAVLEEAFDAALWF